MPFSINEVKTITKQSFVLYSYWDYDIIREVVSSSLRTAPCKGLRAHFLFNRYNSFYNILSTRRGYKIPAGVGCVGGGCVGIVAILAIRAKTLKNQLRPMQEHWAYD